MHIVFRPHDHPLTSRAPDRGLDERLMHGGCSLQGQIERRTTQGCLKVRHGTGKNNNGESFDGSSSPPIERLRNDWQAMSYSWYVCHPAVPASAAAACRIEAFLSYWPGSVGA